MAVDPELVQTLTASLHRELGAIKEIEEQREVGRRAKEKRTEELLERMLEEQAAADLRAEDRRKFLIRFVLGPSGLIAALSGAVLAYVQATRPEQPTATEQVETVQKVGDKVEDRVEALDEHIKRNDRKIERTVEVLLDQQVQISESTDYIVGKIEAAHPKVRGDEDVPESVLEGRRKAAAIRAERAQKPTYNPAKPLEDL